eukprot:1158621-Pelagomonas_calceolata.AAC.6
MLRAAGASLRRALSISPLESSSRLIASSSAVQGGGPDEHHGYEQTPTVFDRLVTINVVDLEGKRRSVRGVVGQTLAQVLVEAGYPRVSARWKQQGWRKERGCACAHAGVLEVLPDGRAES